jgi:outer membrane receptor protein involved in Fe transport
VPRNRGANAETRQIQEDTRFRDLRLSAYAIRLLCVCCPTVRIFGNPEAHVHCRDDLRRARAFCGDRFFLLLAPRGIPMSINRVLVGAVAPFTAAVLLAPGQVAAQQSASAAAMLEEVVVTARRREENLQELPLSIQAITADAMQAQGIYNIQQVTDFAPNVVLQEDQRKNDTRFFVRGIGGGFSNPAQVFGVGMYVDGHYMSGSLGAFMSTVDVERIEVLRGPQGTLFGKNTTGGAISLISAKPSEEFDSYVTLRAADYGQTDLRAMINAPITDNLFFRGNLASEKNDGYYFNRFFNSDAAGSDQQSLGLALRWLPGDNWTIDARLALSYDRDENQGGQCSARPDQDLYDQLIGAEFGGTPANPVAFAGRDLTFGTPDDITYTGPGPVGDGFDVGAWGGNNDNSALRTGNFGIGGSNLRLDSNYPGANAEYLMSCDTDFSSGDIYQTYQDALTYSDIDNEMFTLDATWSPDGAVGPFESAEVQIKGAWRYSSYNYYQDRDFGPGIIDHIGNNPAGSRGIARYTDEFEVIFNGAISDRMDLTAGFYWFDDMARAGNGTCLGDWIAAYDPLGGPISPITGAPEGTINGLPDDNIICQPEGGTFFHRLPDGPGDRRSSTNAGQTTGESTAVYAHLDFAITEQWNLAVGARAMKDDRGQAHIEYGIQQGSCTHNNPGDPSPLSFCNPLLIMNRDTILNDGIHANVSASFDEVTPTISLTRHLEPGNTIDSGILYATISEGYLTGAFNDELNPNAAGFSPDVRQNIIDIIPYGPEHVTNYEVGFKGTLFDGRLRISADVFLMDYTDKQEAIDVDNTDGRFGSVTDLEFTQNAADVEITGIEFELRAQPWDGGFVSIDAGTLNSEYSDFLVTNLDDPSGPPLDVSNRRLANRTPDWTLTATLEHAFQLGNGGVLTPQLGVYMQDDFEWYGGLNNDQTSPHCHQDSYSKWRARVSYEPAQGNWQAALFGYNITDEEILFRCDDIRSGSLGRFYEPPSVWGAEFTMRFGGS